MNLFIEELETRVVPMCILPLHGHRPCNDTIVHPSPSPAVQGIENSNFHAPIIDEPVFTTMAIGEETGGF